MSMTARRLTLTIVALFGGAALALPAVAGAYATLAPPPRYSSVGGLPDGRVYELVSPANKYGNAVPGAGGGEGPAEAYGNATADGNAVMYPGNGPLAEDSSNGNTGFRPQPFVAERTSSGWVSRSVMPRGAPGILEADENNNTFAQLPAWIYPSADLSHFAFRIEAADDASPDTFDLGDNFFLTGSNSFVEPVWIGRPQTDDAVLGDNFSELAPAGGTPDLSTIYFSFEGKLLPEDASRVGRGFYEYTNGALHEAGVLPDGSISPLGAVPAAQAAAFSGIINPAQFDNQVSADGSRAFFVSPDPSVGAPVELYVRETAPDGTKKTVLISQSQLPGHIGEPAPDGVAAVPTAEWESAALREGGPGSPSYVYASPDGSHAFFQSVDQLTSDAPNDGTSKQYVFDLDTGSLEYLPELTGSIVTMTTDGSWALFENTSTPSPELDRWVAGPNGGTVIPIVKLPGARVCGEVCVGPARVSVDGSVVVFATPSPIVGFNDAEAENTAVVPFTSDNIFRYDVGSNELSCVSCPPLGIRPADEATISPFDQGLVMNDPQGSSGQSGVVDVRGISSDGSRVFFSSPDPLVPQATDGKTNVYEWENDTIFLLSSGKSTEGSYFLDNSESGNDVFFSTTDELVKGDNDGAYDVYDARVPHPGDNPPPAAVPCQGDVCQGPPSVPALLGVPASASFNGLGNVEQPAVTARQPTAKKKVGKKTRKSRSMKSKRRKGKKAKRSSKAASKGRGK